MKKFFTLLAVAMMAMTSTWAQNTENGHEYVDLGLTSGTMWATCNVGASATEAAGDNYAWGETTTKSDYSWETYTLCDGDYYLLNKYVPEGFDGAYGTEDGKSTLEKEDDVASNSWGGNWVIPSPAQMEELKTECCWVYTDTYNGNSVSGCIVYKAKSDAEKGKMYPSKNTPSGYTTDDTHIFLPANNGEYCRYWSNTVASNNLAMAIAFDFYYNDTPKTGAVVRDGSTKTSVRPVCKIDSSTPTAIGEVKADGVKARKVMKNGQLVVEKEGKSFDLSGREVK